MPPARYDLAIDASGLNQIAYYDPGDLTLSVDAGMSLAQLDAVLRGKTNFCRLPFLFLKTARWEERLPPARIPRCDSPTGRREIFCSALNL